MGAPESLFECACCGTECPAATGPCPRCGFGWRKPQEAKPSLLTAHEYVRQVDEWLDENVSQTYKDQPLAQHWARVAKAGEEAGEAVDALIAWTGQNPRKPQRDEAYDELMDELADTALTAIYGMQHFTKDADETMRLLFERLVHHYGRLVVRNG